MHFEKESRCSYFLAVQLFSIIVKFENENLKFDQVRRNHKTNQTWSDLIRTRRNGEVRYRINVTTADRSGV